MIKRQAKERGIKKNQYSYPLKETSPNSKYFGVELPEKFCIGKNQFSLSPLTGQFEDNSEIQIEIFDSKGGLIYWEPTNNIGSSNSRILSAHIYHDTNIGSGEIFISGVLKGGDEIYWKSPITITKDEVQSPPIYTYSPKVSITERVLPLISSISRNTSKIGTGSISVAFLNNNINSSIIEQLTRYERPHVERTTVSSSIATSVSKPVERTSILECSSPYFTQDMVNGILYINQVPVSSSTVNLTASIIDVKDSKICEIESIYYERNSTILKSILGHSNFTASYFKAITGSIEKGQKSYIDVELTGIEPVTGKLEYIDVNYKVKSGAGTTNSIGKFRPATHNLLIDKNRIETNPDGVGYLNIGALKNSILVNQYWSSSFKGTGSGSLRTTDFDSITLLQGFRVSGSQPILNDNSYQILTHTTPVQIFKDVEYAVNIRYSNTNLKDSIESCIDISISGSTVQSNLYKSPYPAINSTHIGQRIGSLYGPRVGAATHYFIAKDSKPVKLYLTRRAGDWIFHDISIEPRNQLGFNPGHTNLLIPLPAMESNTEYEFRFDYLGPTGEQSNLNNTVQGIVFSGSNYGFAKITTGAAKQFLALSNNLIDAHGVSQLYYYSSSGYSRIQKKETIESLAVTSGSADLHSSHRITYDYLNVSSGSTASSSIELPINLKENGVDVLGENELYAALIEFKHLCFGKNYDDATITATTKSFVWTGTSQIRCIYDSDTDYYLIRTMKPFFVSGSQGTYGSYGTPWPTGQDPAGQDFPNIDTMFSVKSIQIGPDTQGLSYSYQIRNSLGGELHCTSLIECNILDLFTTK